MIRPIAFRKNEQTAINNYFQEDIAKQNTTINTLAQQEFDAFVKVLRANGVHVIVVEDTEESDTPDSIFPNNWISFHRDSTVAVYPMFAENRRKERREDVLEILENEGFKIDNVVDYTEAENEGVFLEGTGSMIISL